LDSIAAAHRNLHVIFVDATTRRAKRDTARCKSRVYHLIRIDPPVPCENAQSNPFEKVGDMPIRRVLLSSGHRLPVLAAHRNIRERRAGMRQSRRLSPGVAYRFNQKCPRITNTAEASVLVSLSTPHPGAMKELYEVAQRRGRKNPRGNLRFAVFDLRLKKPRPPLDKITIANRKLAIANRELAIANV
jgi:hypothetical protein